MPSALEILVKILKLEREQGCLNKAVIGGLGAYSDNWKRQAQAQARRPEHHLLTEELVELLRDYDAMENKTERLKQVNYMLDRITGRAPMPPQYHARLAELEANPPPIPPPAPPERPRREKPPREPRRPQPPVQDNSAPPAKRTETPPIEPPPAKRVDTPRAKPSENAAADQKAQARPEKPRRPEKDKREVRPAKPMRPMRQRFNEDLEEDDLLLPGELQREDWQVNDADYMGVQEAELDIKPLPRLARPPRRSRPMVDLETAQKMLRELNNNVTAVKGIGPSMAKVLEKLNIFTVRDLLYYLPRRYDDYTRMATIQRLQPDTVVTIIGKVDHTEIRIGKNKRQDFFMVLDDLTGKLNVTFFGQHYLIRSIRKNSQVVLSGKVTIFGNRLQMTNPDWEALDEENLHTIGIVPVYRMTEGLYERTFRRSIKKAIDDWADEIPDILPEAVIERAELGDIRWAISNLHFPEGHDHLDHARRRFLFDELLVLQLGILGNRRDWQDVPGQALSVTDEFLETFIQTAFPYELTKAQWRSIHEIRQDVTQSLPMNRLVQGDVGSGKTAVATVAMAMAVANGKQAALMAPTSILAEQHYRNIEAIFERVGSEDRRIVVALLTSALTPTERESIYRGIADGSIDVVIGTHALIQEGVDFHDLAVAVVDEQHRFGVQQRARLRGKGTNPHLLIMTATPIPRTMALTLYADLDLSIIDEKPAGRQPVQTRLLTPGQREKAFQFIEAQIQQGRQAFVIHPLVEASESIDARSAVEAYEELQQSFHRYRVCLLHGRMKPTEKDEIMAAFARHEYDIMVTTSVAEVGVDIPNASVIVIEGANRFGLAQLHQFRGRVGRGEFASYCLLIPDADTLESQDRLSALVQTNDGFLLAEYDWKLRGAGDLLGTRQSGAAPIPLAEYITPELVTLAQREARTIYAEDPTLTDEKHALLAMRVRQLSSDESDVS